MLRQGSYFYVQSFDILTVLYHVAISHKQKSFYEMLPLSICDDTEFFTNNV